MIRAWLKRRAQTVQDDRRTQGWNFAAGRLLKGESLETVEAWAQYGVDFDGPNPWDQGVLDACRAWAAR